MLEALRSEEIVAMNDFITEKSYVWQSRWRAHAEDRSIFANMLGTSAETWAESGMVVSKIIPRKISDCEFEYTLEARTPESIGSNGKAHFLDRDLPDRLEYYTRIGEMRLSPLQCGYTWRGGNSYRAIPNWQYIDLCPLEALTQLPPNWINQPIKLLEIVEVSYRRGISSENIADIAHNWHENIGKTICRSGIFAKLVIDTVKVFSALLFVAEYLYHLLTVHHFLDKSFSRSYRLLHSDKVLGTHSTDLFCHKYHSYACNCYYKCHPYTEI